MRKHLQPKKDTLRPYPVISVQHEEKQNRLVRRLEAITNFLSFIRQSLFVLFKPVTWLFSILSALIKRALPKRVAVNHDLTSPINESVYVADATHTMNQDFFFMVHQGRIWYKPIAAPKNSSWKLFGKDGLSPSGIKLKALSSDGLNLVAVDESDIVNYVHTNGIQFGVTEEDWIIQKIELDWTNKWFAVPIIGLIKTLFGNNNLRLPEKYRSVAISNKGKETVYYTDLNGKKHPDFWVGVTTLYALSHDGRIYFADPWLGNNFNNEITGPEEGQFVAETMAAAASTLFLLRRNKDGTSCMYTRYADFDSIGCNPFLPATYNPDNDIPLIRRLPAEDWVCQPGIILESKAKLTSKIAILQTGRGQHNRELRVEGTNSIGQPGYYFKNIYEKQWHFQETPGITLDFKPLVDLKHVSHPPVHFVGKAIQLSKKIELSSVSVTNFLRHGLNERGLHTLLELTLGNGKKLEFPLYARRGLAHLFGLKNNKPNWVLVQPKEYQHDKDLEVQKVLKSLFNGKNDIDVSVHEHGNGNIEIQNKKQGFQFAFSETNPSERAYERIESVFASSNKHDKKKAITKIKKHSKSSTMKQLSIKNKQTIFEKESKLKDRHEGPRAYRDNKLS